MLYPGSVIDRPGVRYGFHFQEIPVVVRMSGVCVRGVVFDGSGGRVSVCSVGESRRVSTLPKSSPDFNSSSFCACMQRMRLCAARWWAPRLNPPCCSSQSQQMNGLDPSVCWLATLSANTDHQSHPGSLYSTATAYWRLGPRISDKSRR